MYLIYNMYLNIIHLIRINREGIINMNIKNLLKKSFVFLSVFLMLLQLSSCYKVNTDNVNDYEAFLQKMQDKHPILYSDLPNVDKEQIKDMYLYYSDELIDSYYTIYLNCSFTKEQYETEFKRIVDLTSQYSDMLDVNSKSFSYDSIRVNSSLDFDSKGWGIVDYSYFLLDSENSRIIYVMIFEKEIMGKSVNVPDEYLPSELIELRRN